MLKPEKVDLEALVMIRFPGVYRFQWKFICVVQLVHIPDFTSCQVSVAPDMGTENEFLFSQIWMQKR